MAKLIKPEEHVLSNGIPVIFQHYNGSVAATYWWIRTGSTDESAPEAGFAHFLEHMLFKDAAAKETGKASTGQMARAIESLGGDINAYTSFDQTVYHVTCAAQHWERVIDSFGTMAKPQKFLNSDFKREREVILEELAKNNDAPGRQLFQALFSATFKKHPYGRPVIGFPKTLKAATVAQLESFYKRNYVSGKMGLIMVGPLEDGTGARKKAIIQLLEKHYGSKVIPVRKAAERVRPVEMPIRDKIQIIKKSFDVKTPTLAVSFRAPDLKHPDVPALDLVSSVLAMGELSRLYQQLFYRSSIVTDVSGGLYVPSDPGMIYFQAEVNDVKGINQAAREIFNELDRIKKDGVTSEELQRVIVNSESERLYSTQTADGMAGRLGFLKYILGDLGFDRDFLEELRNVDSKRIQEVASEYFDWRRMSVALLLPKADADFDTKEIEKMAQQMLQPVVQAKPTSKSAAKSGGKGTQRLVAKDLPEIITRPSGLTAVYHANPQSHVMSVHASAFGGLRSELAQPLDNPETDWGSSYMMSLTWTKGTKSMDARKIAAVVEGHAASMDGFGGRNTVGAQVTGLARDWGKLSELFSEVLVDPIFPETEVSHSRRVAEESVRGIEDHTSQLCSKLFLETLFEKHPYGRLTTGSLESLAKIDSEKLNVFHRRWVQAKNLVVSVSGAVKRTDLESWLDALDDRLRSSRSKLAKAVELPKLSDEPSLKAPRWVEKKLGREQLHIIVGGLGSHLGSEDRYALRLMQTLLGGQSGRLFIELREKKSLAYTVSPIAMEGLERGYIGTYIACSPGKREEAVAGIRQVLEQLAAKGPSSSEMKRAQEFYLGRRAMDMQSDSALASHFGLETLYRLPILPETDVVRKIQKITARDIQEVCRKYLVEPHMVTAIVG